MASSARERENKYLFIVLINISVVQIEYRTAMIEMHEMQVSIFTLFVSGRRCLEEMRAAVIVGVMAVSLLLNSL